MTKPCSLLLEVYAPATSYDPDVAEVSWEVSTDPAHPTPYLLGPREYAEQEIDPIGCTASLGTVEIGVIDPPTVPFDQTTGWMTARVHDVKGRRCRLRRYINATLGWVTIADGPAGMPKMDASYSAYRWTIRDTRETERKLKAFNVGGVSGIVPRGSLAAWGAYTDGTGDHALLPSILSAPITGTYQISAAGDLQWGYVNLAEHYAGGILDDPRLRMDDDQINAIQISELSVDRWGPRIADVLWRRVGDVDWNVSRPTSPSSFQQPFLGTTEAPLAEGDEPVIAADYVTLFVSQDIPEGFPVDVDVPMEIIVRYCGPASEAFPYYIEGPLGEVLRALYDGAYTVASVTGIAGFAYDPAEIAAIEAALAPPIRYDPVAFESLVDNVLLRQVTPIDDARAWTESELYAPSGWIPALDSELRISPVSRAQPAEIDPALMIEDAVVIPQPNWNTGARTVSEIVYNYYRYFLPAPESGFEITPDGLAKRQIIPTYRDTDSELRHGAQSESFSAYAFSAVGTSTGLNLPGTLETGSMLAQSAVFDVLELYAQGVPATEISVLRSRIPNVRVGSWVPWEITYFPDKTTGLRGSSASAARIISIRDDDCVWRHLGLEESDLSEGPPGYVTLLERVSEDLSPGYVTDLEDLSDVPSP